MLIERQVIEATAVGYVSFAIPFMRDYLRREKGRVLARYGL